MRSRRKLLSQNFLHDKGLVQKLVQRSSIGKNDTVLEIGPGKGIITQQLLATANHTLAIELDGNLCNFLINRFSISNNFTLFKNDFLSFPLPQTKYKVFANIPFYIEGEAIRKLIDSDNPPRDSYLIIRRDLAMRLAGIQRENQFSLMHKPWFEFSIIYDFKPHDFSPPTKVKASMLRFVQRRIPLIPVSQKEQYREFINLGFGQGLPIIQNLSRKYGKNRMKGILRELRVDKFSKPTGLSFKEWLELYKLCGYQLVPLIPHV